MISELFILDQKKVDYLDSNESVRKLDALFKDIKRLNEEMLQNKNEAPNFQVYKLLQECMIVKDSISEQVKTHIKENYQMIAKIHKTFEILSTPLDKLVSAVTDVPASEHLVIES
mgnify:CR=1 FL=1